MAALWVRDPAYLQCCGVAGVVQLSSDLLLGGNVVAFMLVVVYLARDLLSSSFEASWDSDKEHLGKPHILDPDDLYL